jgi:uncharacterized Tic20 family protein
MTEAEKKSAGAAQEPASAPGQQAAVGPAEKKERTWGMLCHLLALVGFVGIPFGNIIGPLVMWLVNKNESAFVDDLGKESLNFQITVTIAGIVSAVLILVFIGFLLLIALGIFDVVMIILASIKANDGVRYRYPVCIRFLK